MSQPRNNTGNLTLLTRYDFLDLCLLGETGTGKTHTARLIHLPEPLDTLFASGTATEHFTEVALTKEIVENRLSKKITKLERIETDLLMTHLKTTKHKSGTGRRWVWHSPLRFD